jgi:hypothetical protein
LRLSSETCSWPVARSTSHPAEIGPQYVFDASRILASVSSLAVLASPRLFRRAWLAREQATFLDGGGSDCPDVPTTILGPRCATSNCHDSDMPLNNLDLTPDEGLAARLIGVPGDMCMGDLVDADDPSASLVYTKCLVTTSCGIQMPQTGEKLTTEEEECLLGWIQRSQATRAAVVRRQVNSAGRWCAGRRQ